MLTLRSFNEAKTWGNEQKKEYILDQNGKKIYDKKSVHTNVNPYLLPIGTSEPKPKNGGEIGLTFAIPLWKNKIIPNAAISTVKLKSTMGTCANSKRELSNCKAG